MPHKEEAVPGPIEGLHLPPRAWAALQKGHIGTMHQLKAVADRIERLDGIGGKMAQVIRDELARVTLLGE